MCLAPLPQEKEFIMKYIAGKINVFLGVLMITQGIAFPASAQQMLNEAWSFSPQNRASIAALMKQVENQNNGTVIGGGGNTITTLVCGGHDGAAGATANSACIILNNAPNTSIKLGQDSIGDQTATNEINSTQTQSVSGADDILAILNGQ